MQGYKVFSPDFTCLGYQFEVEKTYIHEGEIKLCKSGFHFCEKATDCFSYYSFSSKNIVCEILAENVSNEKESDSKRVCGKITIVKRLSWEEVLNIVNSGSDNSGNCNSGKHNSGNCNSGNCNSGSYNSGKHNSGNCNSGSYNSGKHNSGNCNSGNCNSGSYNSGNCNSGSYNSGSYNSGYFNNDEPTIRIFGKDSGLLRNQLDLPFFNIQLMQNINNKIVDISYKEAWKIAWEEADKSKKEKLFNLKDINGNLLFNAEIFKDITGIDVKETP